MMEIQAAIARVVGGHDLACGPGDDGAGAINLSTIASLVVACPGGAALRFYR